MQLRHRRDVRREKVVEANRLVRMAYAVQLEGELDRAVTLYEKSIRLHPTADAHVQLGFVLSARGDLDGAVRQCVEAIELDPRCANAWNDIGAYRIQQGRPTDALFFLKRATRMKRLTARPFPHYNLHHAYLALGDRERAIEHLQAALEADPEFGPALDALGELLYATPGSGEREPAEEALDELIGSPVLVTARNPA